jgi:preprotein translocase subunit SecF
MLFGLVVGTYSSVFIAAPILAYLGLKASETAAAPVNGKVPQPAE